jgi:carboxyl-terminal processing protease
VQKILLYLLLIVSLLTSYLAGVVSYPVFQQWFGGAPTPQPVVQSADPIDMTVFWEVWHLLDRDFYGEKPVGVERGYGAIRGLVAAFDDPYTRFEEPVQTERDTVAFCGCSGGIGASIELVADRYILHPAPDQPAAAAGIFDGDQLVQVDDTPITVELTIDDVVQLVRGEVGSEVKITVHRPAQDATTAVNVANATGTPVTPVSAIDVLTFVIERVEIQIPSLEWRLLADDPATATIGYIRHTSFTGNSPDEMRSALTALQEQGAERYILDLRGNPGGPVDAALAIADMWIDEGLLLIEEHANGEQERFDAVAGTEVGDAPLVVIVDAGSASASEIVAGALQDHGRAQLIGEPTYGKGSVQLRYELADKSSLFVTSANWFTPNHQPIAGAGLTPDVMVAAGVDPLPAAIASVQQVTVARAP